MCYFAFVLIFAAGCVVLGRSVCVGVFAGAFALDLIYCSVMNFVGAVRNNTPVKRPVPHNRDGEPATRSFAFGMGYYKLGCIWRSCFKISFKVWTVENNFGIFDKYGLKKQAYEDSARGVRQPSNLDAAIGLILSPVYMVVVCLTSLVFCLVFSVVYLPLMFIYTVINLAVLIIVKIFDSVLLRLMKVRADCPLCHKRVIVPAYVCSCGAVHRKLVPNRYGIWKHYCRCGNKLPSTVLTGRSHVDAQCPICNTELFASNMRPISIQLIGGTKAGKSMYLASFFHAFIQRIYKAKKYRVDLNDYSTVFEELAIWRRQGDCPATSEMNSQLYQIVIKAKKGREKRRFAIYDVAGEVFGSSEDLSDYQQEQYGYVDGFLFIIDPFSDGTLRQERQYSGENYSDFSDMAPQSVVNNFINYLIRVRIIKTNERIKTPIAVIISKADIDEVRREIGPEVIEEKASEYSSYDEARNKICRDFLIHNGFSSTVDNIEAQFSNVHFYPVSAIGHSPGTECSPWGVLEPVDWIIRKADGEFAKKIGIVGRL